MLINIMTGENMGMSYYNVCFVFCELRNWHSKSFNDKPTISINDIGLQKVRIGWFMVCI